MVTRPEPGVNLPHTLGNTISLTVFLFSMNSHLLEIWIMNNILLTKRPRYQFNHWILLCLEVPLNLARSVEAMLV